MNNMDVILTMKGHPRKKLGYDAKAIFESLIDTVADVYLHPILRSQKIEKDLNR